jgi:hypothetical protein
MQLFPSMLWFTFKLLLSIKWFNLNQGCLGHFASQLHEQLSNLFGSASIARRYHHEATNNQIEISCIVLWLFLHSEILPCQASEWKNSEIHHKTLVGYLVHFQTAGM